MVNKCFNPSALEIGRRVSISETPTGRATTTTTTNYLWCGAKPCQSINPLNGARNEFYAQGEIQAGRKYYYATDHLGSVTDLLDINGTNVASIDYSPYGRKLKQTGTVQPTFGYAGMMEHQPSGLNLTWYRGYDAKVGRWLSEDQIGFTGVVNLYGYVGDPISNNDPLGLWVNIAAGAAIGGLGNLGYQLWNNGGKLQCVDWEDVGTWAVEGAVVGLGVPEGLLVRGGMKTVSHWGPKGFEKTLSSGQWVMTGTNSTRNWFMSGSPTKYGKGSSFVTTIPKENLKYPSGWEWWKGLIGQRVVK